MRLFEGIRKLIDNAVVVWYKILGLNESEKSGLLRIKKMSDEQLEKILSQWGHKNFIDLLNNIYEAVCILDKDLRILLWNKALERLSGNEAESLINQKCKKNILIQGPGEKLLACSEMCPLIQSLKDKIPRTYKVYILHKEGYRLPAQMGILPIVNKNNTADASLITFHEYSPKVSMPHLTQELRYMNMLDPLTGMGNRRYIEINLASRLEEMKRYGFRIGILFCILDKVNSIKGAYGTVVKDKVIKMIGKTISSNIRFFEFAGRWEEDSFLVILINVDSHKLDLIANKLRLLAEQSSILIEDKLIHTTISIGGVLAASSSTKDSLIKKAGNFAHISQKKGQNRVTLSSDRY